LCNVTAFELNKVGQLLPKQMKSYSKPLFCTIFIYLLVVGVVGRTTESEDGQNDETTSIPLHQRELERYRSSIDLQLVREQYK
jgi:hypothetical protein